DTKPGSSRRRWRRREQSRVAISRCAGKRCRCRGGGAQPQITMPNQSNKLAIAAAYIVLCVVWSSTWLAIKVGLRDLPPISFVAIRFIVAIAVLVAVSIGRVRLLPLHRSDYLLLCFTGLLMFGLNYPLLFWGEKYVSSGLAAVL